MHRIPRALSGRGLCRLLEALGYVVVRQAGSHLRLSATTRTGSHSITIPDHDAIKIGTLNSILADVALAHGMEKNDLVDRLFGS
jgi:predicted RNA binding protein YcfA (HicA-like mRNA interferase family)